MKLNRYLSENSLSARQFAALVGASERAVIKWLRGERIPRPDLMAQIIRASGGAVQPNDFFDAPAPERPSAALPPSRVLP